MGVAEEDDDVLCVEGGIDCVKACVDLEDGAGWVRAEQDVPFILMHGGAVVGPDLKMMQGCWWLAVLTDCDKL